MTCLYLIIAFAHIGKVNSKNNSHSTSGRDLELYINLRLFVVLYLFIDMIYKIT